MPRMRLFNPARAGLFRPQHRMVLGLIAMGGAALLLSLQLPHPDEEPGGPADAAGAPGPAVAVAVPAIGAVPGASTMLKLPDDPPAALGAADPASIATAMDAAAPAVNACAADAGAFQPLDGRLVLALTLGPDGLREAVVEDVAELAPAAVACLSGAVAAVPWPIAEPPVRIRLPFFVVQP
jgi:hypothetical protein